MIDMNAITPFDIHDWNVHVENGSFLVEKLMEYGILPKKGTIFCPKNHPTPMILTYSEGRFKWRCYFSNKKKNDKCNYGVSLSTGTFFARSHLPYSIVCKFILFWLDNIQLVIIGKYLEISSMHTLVDYANFFREVVYDDLVINKKAIEDPGKVVEIDESKFGKRKYHRGKRVEGQWVFGGYERESGESFMVPVEKRDVATLLPIIKDWILPGTTIISDFWRSYDCLQNEGFGHLKVNHSLNFKDPETGAHTNSIEGSWAHAKRSIPAGGRRKSFMAGYLAKFMFVRRCRTQNLDPFIEFCRVAGRIHNPLNPAPEIEDVDTDEESDESEE